MLLYMIKYPKRGSITRRAFVCGCFCRHEKAISHDDLKCFTTYTPYTIKLFNSIFFFSTLFTPPIMWYKKPAIHRCSCLYETSTHWIVIRKIFRIHKMYINRKKCIVWGEFVTERVCGIYNQTNKRDKAYLSSMDCLS